MAIVLTGLLASPTFAEPPQTLGQHMRAMGYLLDEVFARSEKSVEYLEAADKVRELRDHLVDSIALRPAKFAQMNEAQRNAALIEYHQLMARVIYLTATLEHTLTVGNDLEAESGSRKKDIINLLHEINVLAGKAHRMFRD